MNNLNDKIYDLVFNKKEISDNLYDDMSSYQKQIFNNFKEDKDLFSNYSLNDLLFDFDVNFVEKLISLELSIYLEECKENGIQNKKNGSTKNIELTIGDRTINFNRPRLRHEKNFNSIIIPKRTRVLDDLKNNIILLYSKNNSINDIKDILIQMFNIDISTASISKLAQGISENVIEWRNKQLDKCYFCVNIDCTYISIKDKKNLNSHDVPIYVAIGTKLDGHKEIIGLYLGNEDENKNVIDSLYDTDISESKTFWLEVFNDLKDRGLEKILYLCSDGLSGIKDAIKTEFPLCTYQRCIVHIDRNLYSYAKKNIKKQVIKDFKGIYTSTTIEEAKLKANEFLKKYENEKTLIKHATEYLEEIFPLFNVPINIRKYIYTNNIVESANSKIKRGFYGRSALPNVESALNIIYLNLIDLEKKWKKSKVANWDAIYNELIVIHYNDIKQYT